MEMKGSERKFIKFYCLGEKEVSERKRKEMKSPNFPKLK